jgi:hypothetical protein
MKTNTIFNKVKKWTRNISIGILAFIVLIFIIGITAENEEQTAIEEAPVEEVVEEIVEEAPVEEIIEEEPVEQAAPVEEVVEEKPVEAAPQFTFAQENAIQAAADYIAYTAFSKTGLIEQLVYEGYSKEDATLAVENITVDWKEQAVISAQNYLDYTSFSRTGLIEQLVYEGFSQEHAENAVNQVGL